MNFAVSGCVEVGVGVDVVEVDGCLQPASTRPAVATDTIAKRAARFTASILVGQRFFTLDDEVSRLSMTVVEAGGVSSVGRTDAMIVVSDLRKSLRTGSTTVEILKGIDFTVARGEFAAIMGASGSGKSTLLGLLAGLDNPTSGSVTLNGTAISYLAEDKLAQLRGRTIGFVFQSYQLIPTLTALENVLLPYELNDDSGKANDGRTVGLARARELLHSVGLGARMDHYPVQLSGGEQQRVALARAFILRPPIVLADEPTGNLDTVNGQHILELLLHLNRVEGTTLVLVTHDPALAAHAGRRITLCDGMVVSDEVSGPHADVVLGEV